MVRVQVHRLHLHAIGVHGLASVELEVLEVGQELLLDVGLGTLLELGDLLRVGALLLELGLDGLHVALEVGQVALLVEAGGLETEGVDDVVDQGDVVIQSLVGLLGGSVGTDVWDCVRWLSWGLAWSGEGRVP